MENSNLNLSLGAPSKIICVGRNYAAHARELGNEVPKEPLLFLKAPSALIGNGEDIVLPSQSARVEHEAELGIIIGRQCKSLSEEDDPFEYIHGYLCLNDVTARDVQKGDVQFTRGKSFDTFCPVGPENITLPDVSDLRITARVNGEIRQDGRTSQMIFDIPFLMRYISTQMTLNRGDLIATGTPSGVSQLHPGDICEIEIEGIGILRNRITK
ncbi:MAG: fumarylacetoacetate hydrolase family protein [Pyrinomonadaceae bacterium]|nr:fumarylacetoacetate hydrolase family protein [Pyrinomonadaceae bacterium]